MIDEQRDDVKFSIDLERPNGLINWLVNPYTSCRLVRQPFSRWVPWSRSRRRASRRLPPQPLNLKEKEEKKEKEEEKSQWQNEKLTELMSRGLVSSSFGRVHKKVRTFTRVCRRTYARSAPTIRDVDCHGASYISRSRFLVFPKRNRKKCTEHFKIWNTHGIFFLPLYAYYHLW